MDKDQPGKVNGTYLPLDVLAYIFNFLDTKSKGNAAQVCSSWKEAANYKSVWGNVQVNIRNGNLNIESQHSIIKRGIKRFDVYVFEPRVNSFLRRVPDLEHLRFNARPYELDPEEFYRASIPQALLVYVLKTFIKGMNNLKVLHVNAFIISAWRFRSYVETNDFAEEETINEDGLKSLQELCFKNFDNFPEEIIDYICQKYDNLVSLTLKNCCMELNVGFVHLPKLKNLEFLSFKGTYDITDACLENISHILNLKSLTFFTFDGITDIAFEYISRLKNLTHLSFENLYVTDAAYTHINELPLLRELEVIYCSISDEGLSNLSVGDLKLTKFNITGCWKVTDQGILNICQSKFDLHYLDVSSCKITDLGVSQVIQTFRSLQVFYITSCQLVSDANRELIAEKFNMRNNLD